jgi:hypothetical protein
MVETNKGKVSEMMNHEEKKEYSKRMLRIIAESNPTLDEARKAISGVYDLVTKQRSYVGIGPVVNDSKMVDAIFSIFINGKPLKFDDAFTILDETYKELERMASQTRLSLS